MRMTCRFMAASSVPRCGPASRAATATAASAARDACARRAVSVRAPSSRATAESAYARHGRRLGARVVSIFAVCEHRPPAPPSAEPDIGGKRIRMAQCSQRNVVRVHGPIPAARSSARRNPPTCVRRGIHRAIEQRTRHGAHVSARTRVKTISARSGRASNSAVGNRATALVSHAPAQAPGRSVARIRDATSAPRHDDLLPRIARTAISKPSIRSAAVIRTRRQPRRRRGSSDKAAAIE